MPLYDGFRRICICGDSPKSPLRRDRERPELMPKLVDTAVRLLSQEPRRCSSGDLGAQIRSLVVTVVEVTLYTDAACPWAYSANPALRVLEWRYRDQLSWRLVMIGLREDASELVARGYDTARAAGRLAAFRERYAMPFDLVPKERAAGTGLGCRAVVAARLLDPGSEWRVLRALQLAQFTSDLLLDDHQRIRDALRGVPGVDADAIVESLDAPDVTGAYQRDREEARRAAGTAAEAQGKTSTSDGPVRFTAPSLEFRLGERTLVAGGWQPLLAYDVLLANLEPTLRRTPAPPTPEPLFEFFPDGLATAEVALLLAEGPDPAPDLRAAERALLDLAATGAIVRIPLGDDALWQPAGRAEPVGGARVETAVG
jgi:predicted DsbA family dithiol-disulfide isomerase